MRITAALVLLGAMAIAGCGDDSGTTTTPAECEEIAERCHDLDPGSGPIHDCHEMSEGGTAASCAAMREMCFAICVPGGDDAGIEAGIPDGGFPPYCGDGGMGGCCYTHSNGPSADTVSLRVVGIHLTAPGALTPAANFDALLERAFGDGSLDWLFQLSDAATDGPMTVTMGMGVCAADRSECIFADEPQTLEGTITGETWLAGPAPSTIRLVADGGGLGPSCTFELPLEGLAISTATLSEDRSCVGAKSGRRWSSYGTPASSMTAYITVADTRTLDGCFGLVCDLLARSPCETPQSSWASKPDALCTAGACSSGGCDPATTCNAFTFHAQFAAAGVLVN